MTLSFGLTLYHEPPALVQDCLARIRQHYPTDPIFIICDGGTAHPAEYEILALMFNASYLLGTQLKISGGATWWERFFQQAQPLNTDITFKIDADTRLHRKFKWFPQADFFGHYMKNPHYIQGGIQGFSRHAVKTILDSNECKNPGYNIWHRYTDKGINQFSTDHSMWAIANKLKLKTAHWSEVHSEWLRITQHPGDVAASHPHH